MSINMKNSNTIINIFTMNTTDINTFQLTQHGKTSMITTRSVAIAAFYSLGLILGAGGALAQSTNFDNTSLGESGHGTGCSNEPIGAAGDTNCRHQTVPIPNGSPASAG